MERDESYERENIVELFFFFFWEKTILSVNSRLSESRQVVER